MVRKCCVPNCNSKTSYPSHRLPLNPIKSEIWLRAIHRTDLIGIPKEILAKLRICTVHFPEEMILGYGQRRNLIDTALPVLHIPPLIVESNIPISTNQIEEIDQDSSNLATKAPVTATTSEEIKDNNTEEVVHVETVYNQAAHPQCCKLRCQHLLRKKRILNRQRKYIRQLHRENHWEKITADVNVTEKTFCDIIKSHFGNASQKRQYNSGIYKASYIDAHIFLLDQICITTRDRYEIREKALALTLYKTMGKHAYNCLRNVFPIIPSVQTLQLILQKISLSPGLNPFILRHLKNAASKLVPLDKVCILMWSEISIQPNLNHDTHKDIIYGFEDWGGNNRTCKIADHVVIFMLRGLCSGWKIPVSYHFCSKQTSSSQLIKCIKEHISKINRIGFHIVATVCDQRSSNVTVIKKMLRTDLKRNLKKNVQASTFEVRNMTIVPLYDTSNLIMGIRNNLLTKDLSVCFDDNVPQGIVSWDIIKKAWTIDRAICKIRPVLINLTEEHIIENKINKISVKHAAQVLSGKVASYLELLAKAEYVLKIDNEEVSIDREKSLATAETVYFFNNLFDSVNGKRVKKKHDLQSAVTMNSAHHSFWVHAKTVLQKMYYVDKITHQNVISVPTLKNWVFTIESFQRLWRIVNNKYNFKNFKTHYCNQDVIENFLEQIKSHAVNNIHPTAEEFQDSFIVVLMNNMKSISIDYNICKIVDDCMLFSFDQYLDDISNIEVFQDHNCDSPDESHDVITYEVNETSIASLLSEYSTEIINLILKEFKYCRQCDESLKNSEFLIWAKYIALRINKLLKTRSHQHKILQIILKYFEDWTVNMDWHKCIEHHNDIFRTIVSIIAKQTIKWWCRLRMY